MAVKGSSAAGTAIVSCSSIPGNPWCYPRSLDIRTAHWYQAGMTSPPPLAAPVLSEIVVRPVERDEEPRYQALMAAHHV